MHYTFTIKQILHFSRFGLSSSHTNRKITSVIRDLTQARSFFPKLGKIRVCMKNLIYNKDHITSLSRFPEQRTL